MRSTSWFLIFSGLLLACQPGDPSPAGQPAASPQLPGLQAQWRVTFPALPDTLYFAGEQVPLHHPLIRQRLDQELQVQTHWHSRTYLLLQRGQLWEDRLKAVLRSEGVPEDFFYLAMAESGLENVTSPAKAVGYWQFLEKTAKEWGLRVDRHIDERYHPEKSARAAARYLKKQQARFGSWSMAAAAYNRGAKGIAELVETQGQQDYYDLLLPAETMRYVFRILAIKLVYEHPADYGFEWPEEQRWEALPYREVILTEPIDDLGQWTSARGFSYYEFKHLNPWLRQPSIKLKRGDSLRVLLPSFAD